MEKMEILSVLRGLVENLGKEEKKELFNEIKGVFKENKGEGRKEEILNLLRESGKEGVLISEIGEKLGISCKNVSSYISYIRKDGIKVGTRSDGKKFLEE